MPDPKDENDEHLVTQLADEPIVANPVAPQISERTLQGLADLTGVVQWFDPLMQELNDALRFRATQLLQLFTGVAR